MKGRSTPQSSENLEPSALAIAETMIATLLLAYLTLRTQLLIFPATAAVIAPLAFLSTPKAGKFGIEAFYHTLDWIDKKSAARRGLWMVLFTTFVVTIPIFIVVFRVFGIGRALLHRDENPILKLPRNIVRYCFCTDLAHPPELFRGVEYYSEKWADGSGLEFAKELRFAAFRNETIGDFRKGRFEAGTVLMFLVMGICYAVAFFYKISLKASIVAWLPVVWIVWQSQRAAPVLERIRLITDAPLSGLARTISYITIIAMTLKVYLWANWTTLESWWSTLFPNDFSRNLVNQLVWPEGIPLWQIASTFNAIVSLGLYYWLSGLAVSTYAPDAAQDRSKMRNSSEVQDRRVNLTINGVNTVKSIVSIYVIACTLYIVVTAAADHEWPPLEIIIAPWSERPALP